MLTYARINWIQEKLNVFFVGYPKSVKGYKLWNLEPTGQRCIISRDVTFNEQQMAKLVKYDSQSYQPDKVQFEVKFDPGFDQLVHGPIET